MYTKRDNNRPNLSSSLTKICKTSPKKMVARIKLKAKLKSLYSQSGKLSGRLCIKFLNSYQLNQAKPNDPLPTGQKYEEKLY